MLNGIFQRKPASRQLQRSMAALQRANRRTTLTVGLQSRCDPRARKEVFLYSISVFMKSCCQRESLEFNHHLHFYTQAQRMAILMQLFYQYSQKYHLPSTGGGIPSRIIIYFSSKVN